MFNKKAQLLFGLLVFGCFFTYLTEKASLSDQLWLIFAELKNTIGLFTYKYNLLSTNNSIYEPKYGFIPHFPQRPPLSYLTNLKTVKRLTNNSLQYFIWEEASTVQDDSDRKSTIIPIVATLEEKGIVIARFCITFNIETKEAIIISASLLDDEAINNNEEQHRFLYAFVEHMLQEKKVRSIGNKTISKNNKAFWEIVGFEMVNFGLKNFGSKKKEFNFLTSTYKPYGLPDFE